MKKLLSTLLALAMVLALCPVLVSAEGTYAESPVLTEKVNAGELPPVEERLPKNPQVLVNPEVGIYGGTWRQATPQGTYNHARSHMTGYLDHNGLIYDRDNQTIIPTWLESYEHNDEYTVFTFKLREGLKWSDGEPVTMEDVEFWWNDILKNTEYTPSDTYYADCVLDKVDDWTFTFTFETPKPLYLTFWAKDNNSRFVYPAHYLKQFHPSYLTEDEMAAKLAEESFDDWKNLMQDKTNVQTNKDLPVLGPWVMTTDPATTNTYLYERNPYYCCVDQEGNQLPYIDNAVITIVESTDLMNMKIIAGEVDVQAAGLSESFSNYPLFAQYADEMNYRLTTVEHNEPGALNFHFNITSVDPVKAPYLSNVEFRRALSLGMDRPTIISTFYAIGPFVSEIAQSSFLENSPYYDEEWTKQYTQFDPETANMMLDEMGMTQYDENGWRMTADGKAFDLVILVPNYDVQWGEVAEMVASEWRENLKLNINASIVEPSLWGERTEGNEFDITALTGSGDNGFLAVTTGSVDTWTGYASYNWGNRCMPGIFIKSGDHAFEPTPEMARLKELGAQIVVETDDAARDAEIKEVIQIWKDGLYAIGIGRRLPGIVVIKNYVHNADTFGAGWDFGANGSSRGDGYWFDADAQ